MNKKFLSAILFGALMITATSTFVSCKDYDDDIEDLQSQISSTSSTLQSNLSSIQSSLQSELSSTQSSLQSQITSAQSTLQSAIDAKADASEIEALAENVATLTTDLAAKEATLTAQIEAANKAIEELEAASNASSDELQAAIDDANATLAALTGTINDESKTREAADANLQIQLDALNAFQEAVEAADYQAQIDALKAYLDEDSAENFANMSEKIEAVKDELNEAIEANATAIADLQTTMQTISDALDEINPNLDAITVLVKKGVTSIELVLSYTATDLPSPDLEITIATEQTNVFEDNNLDGTTILYPIEFTDGNLYQVPATFVVRVSPVSADLTADMIQFVNSEGGTLDGIVEVTKVEKHEGLLTRAAAATGLWDVSVQLVDKTTQTQMKAVTKTKDDASILFAVQVNNTSDTDATRYATSTYDLTFAWGDYEPADKLYFIVNDGTTSMNVTKIVNRYANPKDGNPSLPYTDATNKITYVEKTWAGSTEKYPTPAVEPIINSDSSKSNVITDGNDDRSTDDFDLYPAVQGEEITISLTNSGSDTKVDAPNNIRAIYVTLDMKANAIESAPSEWNAWQSYEYTGLNEVVEGTKTTITINSSEAINDIIGFRVYAVNYDGTLVDPDGKAFYVSIGTEAVNLNAISTTIVPESEELTTYRSKAVDATVLSKVTGASYAKWSASNKVTINGTSTTVNDLFAANFIYYNADGSEHLVLSANGTDKIDLTGVDLTKITNVLTQLSDEAVLRTSGLTWASLEDGKSYSGTLTIYDASNHVLATLTVTMTKELPTGLPSNFSIKANQVVDGIYYAYLVPDSWEAGTATSGTMDMDQIFNFGTTDPDIYTNYTISFATSDKDSSGKYTKSKDAGYDTPLEVDAVLVDNSTYHETTASYNYGAISSALVKSDGKSYDDYIVTATEFKTVYISIYAENAYTWSWGDSVDALTKAGFTIETDSKGNVIKITAPDDETLLDPLYTEITYGEQATISGFYVLGTSKKDSEYNGTLNTPYVGDDEGVSLSVGTATLTSDSTGNADYFTVTYWPNDEGGTLEFVPVAGASNPVGDVASTLTINCKDSYGNKVVIKLPMTVKERI